MCSAAWPIKDQWNVFSREVYDLRDHEQLETFAGFEYRACCWRLRLGARRFLSTFGGTFDTGCGCSWNSRGWPVSDRRRIPP